MKFFRTTTKRIIQDLIIESKPKIYFVDFKKIQEIKKEIIENRRTLIRGETLIKNKNFT
jgi:hypothetical protein